MSKLPGYYVSSEKKASMSKNFEVGVGFGTVVLVRTTTYDPTPLEEIDKKFQYLVKKFMHQKFRPTNRKVIQFYNIMYCFI